MNKISFNILPSPDTNDHEVRILIDDLDFLGDNYLGIDPSTFFEQSGFDKNGELIIGRCSCGVEGCSDFPVDVLVDQNTVIWTNSNGQKFVFDRKYYSQSIKSAKNDFSWEDIKRKVERLTTNILKHSHTTDGYNFKWASARVTDNKITLSYNKNGDQKLFDIDWDGQTETSVENNAKDFLNKRLSPH